MLLDHIITYGWTFDHQVWKLTLIYNFSLCYKTTQINCYFDVLFVLLLSIPVAEYYQRTEALFSAVCSQKDSGLVIDRYLAETLVTALTDSIQAANSDDPLK